MARQKASASEKAPARTAATEGYTVLARRYRPQTFADLVGQEPVARALSNAIKAGRVAHAYLFTGARGVGKTSTARILARALNRVNGPTTKPCGACEERLLHDRLHPVRHVRIDGRRTHCRPLSATRSPGPPAGCKMRM